ncbi:hypothetical protein [Anabaena sp. CCY 0017]|uniref:hypothetical protein n=1 Tax=Anabaena sp. CCY 0017 TaxID=3103866 RepID=UPI0039C67A77
MPKKKTPATFKSLRLLQPISEALNAYAEDELISGNAAINRLLRDALIQKGYLPDEKQPSTEEK